MRIPGFNAEASLYDDNELYGPKASSAGGTGGKAVIAQRMKLRTVRCDCDTQTDVCSCDNGRVCYNF